MLTSADNDAEREYITGKTSSKPFIALRYKVTSGIERGPKYYHNQLRNITPNPSHGASRGTEAANHPLKKAINQPPQYRYPQGVLIQDIRPNLKSSLSCSDLRRLTRGNSTEIRENQEIEGNTCHSSKYCKPVHKMQHHGKYPPRIIKSVLEDRRQQIYLERPCVTTPPPPHTTIVQTDISPRSQLNLFTRFRNNSFPSRSSVLRNIAASGMLDTTRKERGLVHYPNQLCNITPNPPYRTLRGIVAFNHPLKKDSKPALSVSIPTGSSPTGYTT